MSEAKDIAFEPAFPFAVDGFQPSCGLTKREYFAGMVMTQLKLSDYQCPEHLAQDAVAMTDALLKELAK